LREADEAGLLDVNLCKLSTFDPSPSEKSSRIAEGSIFSLRRDPARRRIGNVLDKEK
jgi:hypothetical protein